MSEKPLFQNADEQESAYDPENRNVLDERGSATEDDDLGDVVLPAGAGAMTSGMLAGSLASAAQTVGVVGPGEAAGADETELDRASGDAQPDAAFVRAGPTSPAEDAALTATENDRKLIDRQGTEH